MSEPLVWAVILANGQYYGRYDFRWEAEAIAAALPAAEGVTATVAPLYRSPTLTDAEREAVEWAVSAAEDCQHPADDTLRGLLERTR